MLENSVTVGSGLVQQYQQLFNTITDGGQFCFMTIAPKPEKELSNQDFMIYWFREFYALRKVTRHLLLVAELTKKGQLHFHFLIRLFPIRNKYTFIKCFVQRWFHMAIIEPIYGTPPRLGLPYLFKTIEETEAVIGMGAHYTIDTIPKDPFHFDSSDDD